MQKILIVEDDTNINNLLQEALSKAGYSCEQAFSGTEAKLLLNMQEHSYALVLLDLMLPGITGEAVLEEIRKKGNLPVIVLTAKDSLDEKVKVLTSGADDYITKPFEIREVLARIQVQLRHTEEKEIKESNLSFREMVLNKATFQVSIGGKILPKITRQEFAILELLLRNPKQAPGLYGDMTAYENLNIKCKLFGIKKKSYIEEILRIIGLEDVGKKKTKHFSLGMKQRLGIGLALVGEPDLLVLDEPINGLDPQGIAEIRDTIQRLQKEKNMTICISSHILEELSKIATDYGIIHNGSLLQEITREELIRRCSERIELTWGYIKSFNLQ